MKRSTRTAAAVIAATIALALSATSSLAGHDILDMEAWATWVDDLQRGPIDIAQPGLGTASWGLPADVVGPASGDTNTVLSLGDGGTITLGFDDAIMDGPGDDFAVFENGFWTQEGLYAEIAFVEVSTNGVDFALFETDALNPFPVPGFGVVLPSDYAGFAGTDPAGLGTGFDLADLAADPLVVSGDVDLDDIAFVRITDVIGDGSTFDSSARPIYDPYSTPFPSSGFDLDGVGVLNAVPVPEPSGLALLFAGLPAVAVFSRRRSGRQRTGTIALAAACVVLGGAGAAQATYVVDFEDLGLAPDSFDNGSGGTGGFYSGPVLFENVHFPPPPFEYWYGFAGSTMTDTTTPGFGNQYSAIAGSGESGSATYGVFFDDAFDDPRLVLPVPDAMDGFYVTNTTYAYLSMANGDAFAKKFGGPTGSDPDWFTLTISGYDETGALAGSVDFDLADFRFADDSLDYILDTWTWVDLSSLGVVKELGFALSSSDTSNGFLNTPAYFAIDGVQVVPEPGTAVLVGLGLAAVAARRRR